MLKDLTIEQYANTLASKNPTPGGGSALANIALCAISLVEMACNVTVNKLQKNCHNIDCTLTDTLSQLATLHDKALQLIDNDATCFDNILIAMRLPKDTQEQQQQRMSLLQQRYIESANSCIQLTKCCVQLTKLANAVIPYCDQFVVSDAHIGRHIAHSTAKANQHNIDVNVDCIADDDVKSQLSNLSLALLQQLN